MRASPGTTQALAEQAFEVLSSGGANSQKEAAAMMGINEKAVSRVKLKTKAPYTKCHTGSTQTVELELGVTWTRELLSYGDSKAERGEAQARAERNYKRKRAALAEVARRRAAEDCGGGAPSEPMDEMAEEASRRESALPVNSARWALEPCSSCHLVPFGPHRLQLEGEPEFDGDFDGAGGGGLTSEDAPLWERIKSLSGFGPPCTPGGQKPAGSASLAERIISHVRGGAGGGRARRDGLSRRRVARATWRARRVARNG